MRERVKALQAAQAHHDGDPNVPAIVRMLANDPDSRFNRSSRNLDEMMSRELIQRRFRRGGTTNECGFSESSPRRHRNGTHVNGQIEVPAGGQVKVPTPCGDS